MAESILIKKASDSDFEGIWEIFRRVVELGDTYAYSPDSSKEEAYDFWMPPNKDTYIAIVNNKIVGTYIIKQNQPGLGSHVANAAYMVHPEDHGHGIGSAMAIHSFEEAKKMNYKAMQFNFVVSTNEAAIKLWKKLGFNVIGTTPKGFHHFSKGLVDTHILHKFL